MSNRERFIHYWRTLTDPETSEINARMAAMDRAADRIAETCEICSGAAVYLCPTCRQPLTEHTHENDYYCETHGFVSPIRKHDGASINGDGSCSDGVRVLA